MLMILEAKEAARISENAAAARARQVSPLVHELLEKISEAIARASNMGVRSVDFATPWTENYGDVSTAAQSTLVASGYVCNWRYQHVRAMHAPKAPVIFSISW